MKNSIRLREFSSYRTVPKCLQTSEIHQCRKQALHSTARCFAVPLPHLAAQGPPPSPPEHEIAGSNNSFDHKKRKLDQLARRKALEHRSEKGSSILQKRFWKEVIIQKFEDGYQIYLDKRAVRIAGKNILVVPKSKPQLASAIALEWDLLTSAAQALKQHYIPLTSLISRALDISNSDGTREQTIRHDLVKAAMRYLATDSLLCWDPSTSPAQENKLDRTKSPDEGLRDIQVRLALPILNYLTAKVWPGIELKPILEPDSILPVSQSEETYHVVRQWLMQLPPFELAGLERAFLASKSLLLATRLIVQWSEVFRGLHKLDSSENYFGIDQAVTASNSESKWQTERWGEVEDTHDVDNEDLRRQLGSVIMLVGGYTT